MQHFVIVGHVDLVFWTDQFDCDQGCPWLGGSGIWLWDWRCPFLLSILWCILKQILIYWGGKVYWASCKYRILIAVGVSFSIYILKLQVIWSLQHSTLLEVYIFYINSALTRRWCISIIREEPDVPLQQRYRSDPVLDRISHSIMYILDKRQAGFLIWQSWPGGERSLHLEVFQDLYYSGEHQIWIFWPQQQHRIVCVISTPWSMPFPPLKFLPCLFFGMEDFLLIFIAPRLAPVDVVHWPSKTPSRQSVGFAGLSGFLSWGTICYSPSWLLAIIACLLTLKF